MARVSDLALLEARIQEAGLHTKQKAAELIEFLKQEVVSAQRIAKKTIKTVTVNKQ